MNKKICIPILFIMIATYIIKDPNKIIASYSPAQKSAPPDYSSAQEQVPLDDEEQAPPAYEEPALADKLFQAIYNKDVNTVLNMPITNVHILNTTNTAGRTPLEEALFQFEQEKTKYIALVQEKASRQDTAKAETNTTKSKRIYVSLLEKKNLINDTEKPTPEKQKNKLFQAIDLKDINAVLEVIAMKNFEKIMDLKGPYGRTAKTEAFLQHSLAKQALSKATSENRNQKVEDLINLDLIYKFLSNKEKQVIDTLRDNDRKQPTPDIPKKLTPEEQAAELFNAIDAKNILAVNNSAKNVEHFEQIMNITNTAGRTPLREAQYQYAQAIIAQNRAVRQSTTTQNIKEKTKEAEILEEIRRVLSDFSEAVAAKRERQAVAVKREKIAEEQKIIHAQLAEKIAWQDAQKKIAKEEEEEEEEEEIERIHNLNRLKQVEQEKKQEEQKIKNKFWEKLRQDTVSRDTQKIAYEVLQQTQSREKNRQIVEDRAQKEAQKKAQEKKAAQQNKTKIEMQYLKKDASIELIKKLYTNKNFTKQSRRSFRYLLEQLYDKVLSPQQEESSKKQRLVNKFCEILEKIHNNKMDDAIDSINSFHQSSSNWLLPDFTLDDFLNGVINPATIKHPRRVVGDRSGALTPELLYKEPEKWTAIVRNIVASNTHDDTCFDFMAYTSY